MTIASPTKSSSRAGRFKKKLVTQDVLITEAPLILAKLAPFQERFSSSQISQADFTAAYLIIYLSHRFPGSWLGSKTGDKKIPGVSWRSLPFTFEPNILKRLEGTESLQDIFANFAFKSTPLAVHRAILEWSAEKYGLELMFRIPMPPEVLNQQKMGRRCVTTVVDQRIATYILGERDALSFTMHDLIHADHFYHHNECYQGQLGFYGLLDHTISYFDLSHEKFASEFEYLIADMNAYAVHLMKCLKSAMVHYHNDHYFTDWLKDLNPPQALFLLNSDQYDSQTMDQDILTWVDQFRVLRSRESESRSL
jgi:hypothetical protein